MPSREVRERNQQAMEKALADMEASGVPLTNYRLCKNAGIVHSWLDNNRSYAARAEAIRRSMGVETIAKRSHSYCCNKVVEVLNEMEASGVWLSDRQICAIAEVGHNWLSDNPEVQQQANSIRQRIQTKPNCGNPKDNEQNKASFRRALIEMERSKSIVQISKLQSTLGLSVNWVYRNNDCWDEYKATVQRMRTEAKTAKSKADPPRVKPKPEPKRHGKGAPPPEFRVKTAASLTRAGAKERIFKALQIGSEMSIEEIQRIGSANFAELDQYLPELISEGAIVQVSRFPKRYQLNQRRATA